MKKFFKSIGWVTLYFFVAFICQAMSGMIVAMVIGVKEGFAAASKNQAVDQAKLTADITAKVMQRLDLILLIAVVSAALIFMLIFKLKKENLIKLCNFSKVGMRDIGLLTIVGVSASFILNIVLSSLQGLEALKKFFEAHEKVTSSLLAGNNIVFTVFVVSIAAPLFEEVLFRGMVFNEFRKSVPVTWAILLQGAVFGLYHMNVLQGVYASVLGILFALLYIWTKSLWAPITVHFSLNLTSAAMAKISHYSVSSPVTSAIFIVCCLGLTAGIWGIWKKRKQEKAYSLSDNYSSLAQ
ncbi:MAG: CPBP family intramembrane metalloprotease [Clostridia bacterium]|nr:CPBP family intramembrane metalloprotease [Clostridia bacterium]